MKKHFLILLAIISGLCVCDAVGIETKPLSLNSVTLIDCTLNKKCEPIQFDSTTKPTPYFTWGITKCATATAPYNTLPYGLTLNQLGVLSGVPAKPAKNGLYYANVCTVKNGIRVIRGTISIIVTTATRPDILTTSLNQTSSGQFNLPDGQMDVPYIAAKGGYNFKATGGIPFLPTPAKPTGYNWSLSWGKIPTGMTFNTVGALSGIPRLDPKLSGNFTQPQTFTFNITATDAVLGNNTKTFSLKINPPVPPTIVTDCPLPEGLELYPYANVYLKATSGKKEYKWSVGPSTDPLPPDAINRFPDGLKLSLAGTISGKPTLPGLFVFRLKVTDANGLTAEKECRITIMPAPEPPKYCFLCLYEGDYRCFPGTTRGGLPPYTWTATGLPPGLSINSSTGEVCGTCSNSGTYETNITVKESSRGSTATSTFTIVVKPKLEITTNSPLPWGIVGRSYPAKASLSPVKIEAIGGWSSSKKWIVLFGKLPDDLKLDPDTGIIYGTPSKKGTYKFTIRVQDECKPSSPSLECDDSPRIKYVDKEFVIDIYDPITLPTPPIPCLTVNKPFSTTLTASGGKGVLTWQIISVSSPAYNIASSVGKTATLEGTPSISGPVTLKIRVTDENLDSEDFTLNYSAFSEVKITSGCPPSEWTSGKPITPLKLTATGGSGGYTWSKYDVVNKPWPSGLDINNDQIQGIPILSSNSKTFQIAYRVVDSCGNEDIKECEFTVVKECNCKLESTPNGSVLAIALDTSGSTGIQDVAVNGVIKSRWFAFNQILTDYTLASSPNRFDGGGSSVSILDSMISRAVTALGATTNFLKIVILNDSQDQGTSSWSNTAAAYTGIANLSLKIDVYYIRVAGVAPNPTVQSQLVSFIAIKPTYINNFYQNSFTTYTTGGAGELSDILTEAFSSQYRCNDKFGNEVIVSTEDANSIEEAKNIACSQNSNHALFSAAKRSSGNTGNAFANVSFEEKNLLFTNDLIKNSTDFKIGINETCISEYADFLNAIARNDTNSVYNPLMAKIGILKSSLNGISYYSVNATLEDYPVAYVSWFDAARYANWMANGKSTGAQSPTTTENGVYNLGASSIVRNAINPNTGKSPTHWLLNESEWYTSAYLKSDATALWAYPTQSNTAPDANGSNPANLANFGSAFDGTTPVGFFDRSPGPFGTFDQAGNVREWTESLDTSSGTPLRIIRGGSWADPASSMRADESHVADPTLKDDKTGFRIGGAP
jgi:formylglycine-generating enzyme required for sulfatase activity